jgi:cardiolipin synthase
MTIPNALTFARLCSIPVIVLLIHARSFGFAFALFVAAGLTDALDGWVARRFNQKSEVGAYLDALADKALIAASLITLEVGSMVPLWLLVLVLFRDAMIVGAVAIAWLMDNPIPIDPLKISKANTALQIVLVGTTLAIPGIPLPGLAEGLLFLQIAVAALTILSVGAYFAVWFRHMA